MLFIGTDERMEETKRNREFDQRTILVAGEISLARTRPMTKTFMSLYSERNLT